MHVTAKAKDVQSNMAMLVLAQIGTECRMEV